MSDYVRSTRECTLASMSPALAGALQAHAEQYALGDVAATALMCCETTSRKAKKGLFGKEEVILTGVVLTQHWLVWAAARPAHKPAVLPARLRDIGVQDYENTPMHTLVADTGLNVTGLRADATTLGSTFIGLGPEPAAARLRASLTEAMARQRLSRSSISPPPATGPCQMAPNRNIMAVTNRARGGQCPPQVRCASDQGEKPS
jgi:hypothetical protein